MTKEAKQKHIRTNKSIQDINILITHTLRHEVLPNMNFVAFSAEYLNIAGLLADIKFLKNYLTFLKLNMIIEDLFSMKELYCKTRRLILQRLIKTERDIIIQSNLIKRSFQNNFMKKINSS